MRSIAVTIVSLSLAACAPTQGGAANESRTPAAQAGPSTPVESPPQSGDQPAAPTEPQGSCNADAVQDLRGRHLNDQILGIARERSGAKDVRVIQPGQAVTMDFRPDRLNIEVMEDSRIVTLSCG